MVVLHLAKAATVCKNRKTLKILQKYNLGDFRGSVPNTQKILQKYSRGDPLLYIIVEKYSKNTPRSTFGAFWEYFSPKIEGWPSATPQRGRRVKGSVFPERKKRRRPTTTHFRLELQGVISQKKKKQRPTTTHFRT